MPRVRAAKHHWWPKCVSAHWADSQGQAHWIDPRGAVRSAPPAQFGAIRDGHTFRLGADGQDSPWDDSFEAEFQAADSELPSVIEHLSALGGHHTPRAPLVCRFSSHSITEEEIAVVVATALSLVVRCPRSRESAVALAEHLRGPLPEKERNALIAGNLRGSYGTLIRRIGGRGKLAILFSPDREFIYGDGLFSNITIPPNGVNSPKFVVPLTPTMSIAYVLPVAYRTEPRLVSLVLTSEEVDQMNHAVQVYSRSSLFYRSERPKIDAAFKQEVFARYSSECNPVDRLLAELPGIPEARSPLGGWF